MGAGAVPGDEDVAEEPRALAHRAEHGRGRVGGQLVRGVQEQVVPQHARGAQLALVQGGARVGGGGARVVGGRWRDEERLGPVPELLLLGRRGLVGLLSFGRARLMLPGNFLKRGECCDSDTWAFPTGRFHRLRDGELPSYSGPLSTRLTPASLALKSSHLCFGPGGFWWLHWGENWCGGNPSCLEGDGGGRNSGWARKNQFTFFIAYHCIPIWRGIQLSGPFNSPLLPRDRHQGQITHVLRRGQNNPFREAGQRLWGRKRGSGLAKVPRASDPHWALFQGNFLAEGEPSMILRPLSCAPLEIEPVNLPLTTPHYCSQHWWLICSKPLSSAGFLSAVLVYFMAAEPSIVWKEGLPHGYIYTNK